jgi:2,3-bisphosphoglycerate-independent phosphoglycerate mutase
MSQNGKKTTALIILDGWGYREDPRDNAIAAASTPVWDQLWREAPHTLISGSGLDVGLPEGQMGNSEVGHMSLGSGRVVYQNISRIDAAIGDGSFMQNQAYTHAIDSAIDKGGSVHIFGLLSPGGVHSHEDQIIAAVKLAAARSCKRVYVHSSLQKMDEVLKSLDCGRIASLIGRYYAMDRDNRWDRIEIAYRMLTEAQAEFHTQSATEGLENAYERGENDEFVKPTVICGPGEEPVKITPEDAIVFMNFRSDRARQLTRAFVDPDFNAFERVPTPAAANFVMTTEYAADIEAAIAFPPSSLSNVLGEYLANLGKTQLRIAETEKYAHVTFFFSGGREALFEGEERIMVASPEVATYDLQPQMSAPELTDKLVEAIHSNQYDLIVCNFANGDMVGHTGVFDAAVQAVEALDDCIGRVRDALLEAGGQGLITADHGNCEQMTDYESGQVHTQHTTELVPLVYIGDQAVSLNPQGGILADIAPTLLALMSLPQPQEMTGSSLLGTAS